MQIPLDQFEQVIDEKILQRGLTYFKKGLVHELEEVSPNTYEAIVEGTEDYTVRLTVENNVVTDYNCDCPYDLGPVCKHVAAVIFSLQEEELGRKPRKTPCSVIMCYPVLNITMKTYPKTCTKSS